MSSAAPMRPENVRYGEGYYDHEKGHPVCTNPRVGEYKFPAGLATEKGYDQSYGRVEKLKYTHDAMIDVIVAEPRITQRELSAKFGYSENWVSRVIGSDAFQAALAKRREEITDPFLVSTVEERLKGLAAQSMDIIAEKLAATQSLDAAMKVADMSVKALGFGARERSGGGGPAVTNQFVVNLPPKASSSESWAEAAARGDFNPVEAKPARISSESLPMSTTITRDPLIQPTPMRTEIEE